MLHFSREECCIMTKKINEIDTKDKQLITIMIVHAIQSRTSNNAMRKLWNSVQDLLSPNLQKIILGIIGIMTHIFTFFCISILIIGPVNALVNRFVSISPTSFFSEWKKGALLIFLQVVGELLMPLLLSPINDLSQKEFENILQEEIDKLLV